MAEPSSVVEPVETTRAFWQRLGLPGLFDIHVHFLPPPVQAKVWDQFDRAGPLLGRRWPIRYRGDDASRVETLRAFGVRRFTALPYAHRPGVAEYLNDWAGGFAASVPEALTCATFFPEPGAASYVEKRIATTDVFKVHVQVGDFDLTDPLLDDVWGLLAEAGTPVVIHAGSGPGPNSHTGPGPVRAVLDAHPPLTVVVIDAAGAVLVPAYNLELYGGRLHNNSGFALAWGAFPALTGWFVEAQTMRFEAVGVAAYATAMSLAKRTLSTPVRRARREQDTVEGTETFERTLRWLTCAAIVLAVAVVAARLR